jgi:hypothetical protein
MTLFKEIRVGKYVGYTSGEVIRELAKAPAEKYAKMFALIAEHSITVLPVGDEAETLADIYVAEGIIPERFRPDGLHIAIAAVNDLDMIVSMNFKHIVKRKTIKMTANVNTLNGYRAVEIYSPMEVIDDENAEHD